MFDDDGGFVICHGQCANCHIIFGFNPHKVPAVRGKYVESQFVPCADGHREPVCESCAHRLNGILKEKGLPQLQIPPDAYDPMPEGEL